MCNDNEEEYQRKQSRLENRFAARARTRDAALETDLFELYQQDMKEASIGQFMLDPASFKPLAIEKTQVFREYMVKESLAQYQDYYESDGEEQQFF